MIFVIFHARTKHVESDCHVIRDEIVKGVLKPEHVSTTNQLADIFTKALGRKEFDFFLRKLGICDLHTPNLGGGVLGNMRSYYVNTKHWGTHM